MLLSDRPSDCHLQHPSFSDQVKHLLRGKIELDRQGVQAVNSGDEAAEAFEVVHDQRHSGQHRHGRLAHAHHVAIAVFLLQVTNKFLHVVHVVVEVKFTF
jgi:hypothetical protein